MDKSAKHATKLALAAALLSGAAATAGIIAATPAEAAPMRPMCSGKASVTKTSDDVLRAGWIPMSSCQGS